MVPEMRSGRRRISGGRQYVYNNIELLPYDEEKLPKTSNTLDIVSSNTKDTKVSQVSPDKSITYKRVRENNPSIYKKVNATSRDIRDGVKTLIKQSNSDNTSIEYIKNCFAKELREQVDPVIDKMCEEGVLFKPKPDKVRIL
jgi:hypothetical protein